MIVRRWLAYGCILVGLLLIVGGTAQAGWNAWVTYRVKADVRARLSQEAGMLSPAVRSPASVPQVKASTPLTSPGSSPASRPTVVPAPTRNPTPTTALRSSPPKAIAPTASPPPLPTPTPTPLPPAPPVWLRIPALGIDTPVVPVYPTRVQRGDWWFQTWETADYAAGYHVGSAYPGQPGNVVISGHNNIAGAVFRPLSVLGDEDVPFPEGAAVYLTDANGRTFLYRFAALYKVREVGATPAERAQNARFIASTQEPVLTLVTCWPVTGNTHRVIVRAILVGEVTERVMQSTNAWR